MADNEQGREKFQAHEPDSGDLDKKAMHRKNPDKDSSGESTDPGMDFDDSDTIEER